MEIIPDRLLWRSALLIFCSLILGCKSITSEDLAGLWQLEMINIDGTDRPVAPVFMDIRKDNRFAVSQVSGDQIGFYSLSHQLLELKSRDKKWFNTSWSLRYFKDHIILHGKETPYRTTHLRFRRIDKIPTFEEFETSVIGKWKLYKIREGEKIKRLSNTWFNINENGQYVITQSENQLESGTVVINTRHRKIIFVQDEITWNAWFYGEELRLENDRIGIQYSLKKR